MEDLKTLVCRLDKVEKEIARLERGELNEKESAIVESIGKTINLNKIHEGLAAIIYGEI